MAKKWCIVDGRLKKSGRKNVSVFNCPRRKRGFKIIFVFIITMVRVFVRINLFCYMT